MFLTHGLSRSILYRKWVSMLQRCSNKNHPNYKRYGGAGITVCAPWLDFSNFLNDMGIPEKGLSLDRIDNSKGYFKENCRWVSRKVQSENRGTPRNNTSGFKGVWFDKRRDRFVARIKHNRKTIFLGSFATGEEASKKYQEAVFALFT